MPGDFLNGRRSRWLVATKFSGRSEELEATLETQLQRLGIDAVDLYQIHWAPSRPEQELYEALCRVRKAGKARLDPIRKTGADVSIRSSLKEDFVDGMYQRDAVDTKSVARGGQQFRCGFGLAAVRGITAQDLSHCNGR